MWAVAAAYLCHDLLCGWFKSYAPNVLLLHRSVPVCLNSLRMWSFSWCFRNASRWITYHLHVACTLNWQSVPYIKLQEAACGEYKTRHVLVTKLMDAVTAREHWLRCRHCLQLQLPLLLPLILVCSLCAQWNWNGPAGFFIRDWDRQVIKTAESSGSATNARCGAGYNAMCWVCQ